LDSVASPESPDRICNLLNERRGSATHAGREQPAAIAGYFSRHIVPAIRFDG